MAILLYFNTMIHQGVIAIKSSVRNMTSLALMTALVCVIAPLQIPLGPVPFTLQTLFIALTGYLLGCRSAAAAIAAYLLLGAVGMPVFSGWTGGIGAFAGPTGGFLPGFLLLTALCGLARKRPLPLQIAAGIAGLLLMDLTGVCHLMLVSGLSLPAALTAGVCPFLIKDVVSIAAAALLARKISARLPK